MTTSTSDGGRGCAVPGCTAPAATRGHCARHYKQVLRHGEVRSDPQPVACAVEPCDRTAVTRGWCHGHYLRWTRSGEVREEQPLERPRTQPCKVDTCTNNARARGCCRSHEERLRTNADVGAGTPLRRPAPEGGSVSHGYWMVELRPEWRHLVPPGRKSELAHRLVMAEHLGRPLTSEETVHHKNGDRLDNLELWSTAQPKGERVADKLR